MTAPTVDWLGWQRVEGKEPHPQLGAAVLPLRRQLGDGPSWLLGPASACRPEALTLPKKGLDGPGSGKRPVDQAQAGQQGCRD